LTILILCAVLLSEALPIGLLVAGRRALAAIRLDASSARDHSRQRFEELTAEVAEVWASLPPPAPRFPFALTEDELRQWALQRARREEIEALDRLLARAGDELQLLRQALADAPWIEV